MNPIKCSNECQNCPFVNNCMKKIKISGKFKDCTEASLHLDKEKKEIKKKRNKKE